MYEQYIMEMHLTNLEKSHSTQTVDQNDSVIVVQISSAGFDSGNYAVISINANRISPTLNENSHDRGLHVVMIDSLNASVVFA